ncbi:hypothetical protein GGR20_003349 [Devosia subaequoris]|uniref:Uncharacterized protein n=1 Tax=Devosia subaequoris TaxID=395930 RepID=A0A7W6IPY9_9HYPH|nr:hypothetical protein [Devosia subaequoris]MBB4053687.1 hypothetical protein [Devosia subaequoris]MCP1211112.1 hypothetical protein [Devosia subaequoris]
MTDAKDLERAFDRVVQLVEQRGLPGTSRSSGTSPALLVADSTLAALQDEAVLALACPEHQKVLLMDISPKVYFETEQQIGQNVVLVHLDRIDDEELSLRLHDAWEYVAPDNLRKYVD